MCSRSPIVCFPCCYPTVEAQHRVRTAIGQTPEGFAFPLAGLSKIRTSTSLLVKLFNFMYLLYQKEQVKNIAAWDWDADRGASWKDQEGQVALLFSASLRTLGARKFGV